MWRRIAAVFSIVVVICVLWVVFRRSQSPAALEADVRRERMKDVPTAMLELYHKGPHALIPAEIVKSLTPKQIGPMQKTRVHSYNQSLYEHGHFLIFDVPGIIPGEELHSAQLHLTLSFIDRRENPVKGIEIKTTVTVQWDSGAEPLVQHVYLQEGEEISIHFNCTQALSLFHKRNRYEGGVLKIIITIKITAVENLHPEISGDGIDSKPLLLLLYTPKVQDRQSQPMYGQRKKRNIDADDYEEETNSLWPAMAISQTWNKPVKRPRSLCRRKPLYIDFSEIQYDSWIVAPNGYQAFQCTGKCVYPLSDHLSPTKHAIVQTLLHSISPMKAVRSCCVPTRLDSISVLYLDPHGVLTYRFSYKDMVVAECGCR